jgi:anti-sigma factor (TIGR02949 family)
MTTIEIRSCEEALRHLAAHIDRELDPPVREQIERHLATCRRCYSHAEFESALKARMGALGHETVRPALADRVQTLIRRFTVAGGD